MRKNNLIFIAVFMTLTIGILGCKKTTETDKNPEVDIECDCTDGMYKIDELVWPDEDEIFLALGWAVRLKLKLRTYYSGFSATEDSEIQDLLAKHGVTIMQIWLDPKAPLELLLLYYLKGPGNMNKESRENAIKDFLCTKKFENDVYLSEYVTTD